LRDAAALVEIKLMDHLIVAGGAWLSMADEGLF
jgi:DNA repair protein RadC